MPSQDLVPEFVIVSKREVRGILCADEGATFRNIISIGDSGEPLPPFCRMIPALRLEFSDVQIDRDEMPASYVDELTHMLPTRTQIEELVKFCRNIEGKTLLHCFAGLSRSPAAACVLVASRLGPGYERETFERVLRVRPSFPNVHVLEHADAILGTRLVEMRKILWPRSPAPTVDVLPSR